MNETQKVGPDSLTVLDISTLRSGPPEENGHQQWSGIDILEGMSEEAIQALLGGVPMRSVTKGTVFYAADQGTEVLFMLKSGRAELYRESPNGKKLTVAIVEEGTFFGEMSLVGQRLLGTAAVAIEDSEVCALGPGEVRSLIMDHPIVALRLIEVLAGRLHECRDAYQEMAFYDVTGRLAVLLLRLADEETGTIEGYSHQDLASMVGCLRESFTATLDRLRNDRAVKVGRRRIEIVDRPQLERLVQFRSGSHVPGRSN